SRSEPFQLSILTLRVGEGYLRTRVLDQYRVNIASWLFCNRSATSFVWKGRSSESSSRLSNSVISSAVLGFLIVFSAREMCASRRRLEFGICLIPASSSRKMNLIPEIVLTSASALWDSTRSSRARQDLGRKT